VQSQDGQGELNHLSWDVLFRSIWVLVITVDPIPAEHVPQAGVEPEFLTLLRRLVIDLHPTIGVEEVGEYHLL
jgi:hypothetical protein